MSRRRQKTRRRVYGRAHLSCDRPCLTVVFALAVVLGVPDAAGARGIGVSAPLHESPGGTVPTIVTAYDVPPRYTASITATGPAGRSSSA